MQGQPITGLGSSSLPFQQIEKLPTPVANDMGGNKTIEWWDEWCAKTKAKHNNSNGHGPSLNIEVLRLMPTPQVDDAKNTGHNQDRRPTLASEVWETERETDWGKFAPAIERWEAAIDCEAPAPTKPDGKDGQHRLSAEFTEWMMGLPAGWVTDPELGLTRNEQLKLCGNGVVPQQAALALTRLLTGIDFGGKNESDLVMPTLTTNGTGRHSAGYDSWEQVNGKIPAEWRDGKAVTGGGKTVMLPTPTVSDIYTDNLASTQQKPGSMHSVTLAQAAKWVNTEEQK